MRKISLTLLLLVGLTIAQTINVVERQVIAQKTNQTKYAFPIFSPGGEKVLFTATGYKGLWVYDKNTDETVQLNDLRGAGYQPVFSKDGESVFFRHDNYIKRRKFSTISSQSLKTKKISTIVENERHLSTPKPIANNIVAYKNNTREINVELSDDHRICLLEKPATKGLNAFSENGNLYIDNNGKKEIFNPLGDGKYIWGSLSPDKSKVLFRFIGKGTYVTDLNKNIIFQTKSGNYPQWSADGKWIVYMNDEDDGHRVTSSDLITVHLETKKSLNLTQTKDKIELYPQWSPVNNEIIYHTASGNIELLKLEIQE